MKLGHYTMGLIHYVVYNSLIIELQPYVLDPIRYILNLLYLKHFIIVKQMGFAIEKTRYLCVCFCCDSKWCFNVINGLCHINVNPIWIFGHNVGQCTSKNVNN